MNREEIQNMATEAIIKAEYNGILDIAPRVGKSKILIDAIRNKSEWNIVISSPFETVRKNWLGQIEYWKLGFTPDCICSKSLKKIPDNIDLLVLDEAQMLSLKELITIQKKKPKRIIVLSGTMNATTKADLFIFLNIKPVFTYSINQAIEDNIISNFEINIIRCDFDNIHKVIQSGTSKYPKIVTEKEHHTFLDTQFKKFKNLAYSDYSFSYIKDYYARKRKDFIYHAKSKLELTKKLVDKSDRCLVFTGFTEEANYLCEKSYTVKNKKEDNLNKLINQEIDKLSVINMSSVGITVPNLKHVIIHQCQSNDEMALQKILRACNLEGDRIARIDVLCYKDTVDEDWVNNAFSSVKKERIRYLELEDMELS